MNRRVAMTAMALAASLAWAAAVGADHDAAKPASAAVAEAKTQAETEAKSAATAEAKALPAAHSFGKDETAKWTATTWEAAATEANKKVLESGKVATITGEVVDVSCYLQLGKRGEAHIACGSKCIANGQPIGIVDASDNLFLLMAEEHHPRRDGQVELKTVFAPWLAKQVKVTGMMTQIRGYKALFVQAAELGGVVPEAAKPAEGTGAK
jgi:hypothetical protein